MPGILCRQSLRAQMRQWEILQVWWFEQCIMMHPLTPYLKKGIEFTMDTMTHVPRSSIAQAHPRRI